MSRIQLFNHIISIGSHAIDDLSNLDCSNYSNIFCLVDENTEVYCLPVFKNSFKETFKCLAIKSGEENKTFETCVEVWQQLVALGANRNSLLINLGGGVISDIGGFIADNYKRGIKYINVPTTLLSMVDASIGGKTGVNLDSLKNQIGSFNFPEAVFIIPEFLKTLNDNEIKQGYAEILKHALIADVKLWDILKTGNVNLYREESVLEKAILIKANIVEQDPKEKGDRKLLNFGHTIGHAIESWPHSTNQNKLSHGEAIAIGIIAESFLSYRCAFISFDELKEICDTVYLFFNPVYIPEDDFNTIIELMQHDKKNKDEKINFTLLNHIGTGIIDQYVTGDLIKESLEFYKTFPDRNYIAHK